MDGRMVAAWSVLGDLECAATFARRNKSGSASRDDILGMSIDRGVFTFLSSIMHSLIVELISTIHWQIEF